MVDNVIIFPYSVPQEVIEHGYEAYLWADEDRKRLGFKMEPIRWVNLNEYVDDPKAMISLFPIYKSSEAILRVDWTIEQLTKYVRLTNYRELQRTHKDFIDQFLLNGIKLYLANCKNVQEA